MTDVGGIQSHLERRFAKQRVVFWHDAEGEYVDDIDMLELPGVVVVRVANNEYAVKQRLLLLEPKQKFLVYRMGSIPEGIDNWLLDLELAYGVFTADRPSLLQQELGLEGADIRQVLVEHQKFFHSAKRVRQLQALLEPGDDSVRMRAKMKAVLLGQREHSLSEIVRVLLIENAAGKSDKFDLLCEYDLDAFHWEGVATIYGYASLNPTVEDFVLWMFQQAITRFRSEQPSALRNIQLDFGNFRYDVRSQASMALLARRAERDLNYASSLNETDYRELVGSDLFEVIDQKIISDLAQAVASRTVLAKDVSGIVRSRQTSFWIDDYRALYTAIDSASELLTALDSETLSMQSFDDGLERYRTRWYRIDQLYRQFTQAARSAEHSGPIEALRKHVEPLYSNKYLQALGAAWQQQVDGIDRWRSTILRSQTSFFVEHVQPIIRGGRNKAVVIISDAMRYEVADELGTRIRREDRFDAELGAVLGVLPSYTQLGMAALLPHRTIGHSGKNDLVNVDGQPAGGTANRNKILAAVDGFAITAEDVLALDRDALRELYQAHQVLYIYHNRIDATGDKPGTERQVFGAVEETLTELTSLIKKLTNANATNILVTADHGFVYQDSGLDETGYLSVEPQGDQITVKARRYVLGAGLKKDAAFATFTPQQLGLDSQLEVQIPKSIHRLRLQGSGARFVHGGATLQEIVVPVLTVNKKRKSDIRSVTVEILPESNIITTGQIAIKLYQADPVSDKVQSRSLRAGIFVGETLISNQVDLNLDQRSDDKRDRYATASMLLSNDANVYNNRAVEFRLEEQIPNTNQWRTYKKAPYTLKRSFTTDF